MVHAKTVLLDQLLANSNDRSWYMSFQEAVEGISEERAFWKPDETSHSIAEITQHLIYWNETWQKRYEKADVAAVKSVEENADSFLVPQETDFQALKKKLIDVLLHWQEIITEQQLEEKVNGFPVDAEWWALIANATTHNAYHIGQIVFSKKMERKQ